MCAASIGAYAVLNALELGRRMILTVTKLMKNNKTTVDQVKVKGSHTIYSACKLMKLFD